jgi:hypothetical protein
MYVRISDAPFTKHTFAEDISRNKVEDSVSLTGNSEILEYNVSNLST